jgi:hypothetical protein
MSGESDVTSIQGESSFGTTSHWLVASENCFPLDVLFFHFLSP